VGPKKEVSEISINQLESFGNMRTKAKIKKCHYSENETVLRQISPRLRPIH